MKLINFLSIFLICLLTTAFFEAAEYLVPFNYWNPTISNISSSSASAPQIAINDSGQLTAIWALTSGENSYIKASSSANNNSSWTESQTLSSNLPSEPQININASNSAVAVWTATTEGVPYVETSYSSDGGATWGEATTINDPPEVPHLLETCVPQITINDSSRAVIVFNQTNTLGTKTVIQASYSSDSGASWLNPDNILTLSAEDTNAINPQIILNNTGQAITVWQTNNEDNKIIQATYSTDNGENWSSPTDLSATGQDAAEPQIAMNDSGEAIAVWYRSNGANTIVQAAYSSDGGQNWSSPINLSSTGQNAAASQIAINSSGKAIAIWHRSNGSNTIVQSSYSSDKGASWSTPTNLSTTGQDASSAQIALNDSDLALTSWHRSTGENTRVQSTYSLNAGASWSNNFNFSAEGASGSNSQLALNSNGLSGYIWKLNTGENNEIQAGNGYKTNATVNTLRKKNRFPLSVDLINQLSWDNMSEVTSFKIYQDAALNQSLSSTSAKGTYTDHQMKHNFEKYYYFTVIANEDIESPSVKITMPSS